MCDRITIEEIKRNSKLRIAFVLLLLGIFFVTVDATIYGRYTGEPNTLWGWIGLIFGCLSMISQLINNSEDRKEEEG